MVSKMNGEVNGISEQVEQNSTITDLYNNKHSAGTDNDVDQDSNLKLQSKEKEPGDKDCESLTTLNEECHIGKDIKEKSHDPVNNVSKDIDCNGKDDKSDPSTVLTRNDNGDDQSESRDSQEQNVSDEEANDIEEKTLNQDTKDCNASSGKKDTEDDVIEDTKPTETVCIPSDSEDDDNSETKKLNTSSDVILIDNDNVKDAESDIANKGLKILDLTDNATTKDKTPLRRSSRVIKRKKYDIDLDNDEDNSSDIEEMEVDDFPRKIPKPIPICNKFVGVEVKQMRPNNVNSTQNKESNLLLFDSKSKKGIPIQPAKTPKMSTTAQNLYQSILACGTTVTPVSKAMAPALRPQSPVLIQQPAILPSLTDDMFVVEAPSFIVPYVYEKPSLKPFRKFVNELGKELELQKEKEKEEKELRAKIRREKRAAGEEVEDSEDETNEEEEKKKKKAVKKEKRRRRKEDDDASWDGESSSDSDDDISENEDVTDNATNLKNSDSKVDKSVGTTVVDSFFTCELGKFFSDIGLNLVQEHVQNDLLKQQTRKLSRDKKAGHSTKAIEQSIASLKKNIDFSKENNAPYALPQKKCEFCSFKTESSLVLDHHLETPHMKNNMYKCNFCEYEIKSPHEILFHMESKHHIRGKLERALSCHQCCNCPFEDNGKGKLARHLLACAKKFKPATNLAPPIDWEPPAKIPKLARARSAYDSVPNLAAGRAMVANRPAGPVTMANIPIGKPRPKNAMFIKSSLVRPLKNPPPTATSNGKGKQPSISITPLPRQPVPQLPTPQQMQHSNKNTFVICEICDGYIKDLEQLRNHMQWIHKVKIHPKMIYNRPPLNCQKCQFRFFTDQGLERHLLGSHGLVTSSMQEAANKGKDAGRCPVCGRVYQWKLLNHVARDHNVVLKPAHLSYKCTVCTATFGMYKLFENHVYSAHSVQAGKKTDKPKSSVTNTGIKSIVSTSKPLKINDEITITPQSKANATVSSKSK